MSKNARVFALAALIVGGLTFWMMSRPGSVADMEMERREVVTGDGFELAVPEGFLFVTDDRMALPEGGVALARPAGVEDRVSTVIVVPVPPKDPPFDPTSDTACQAMGEQLAGGGELTLVGAGLVDAPFGTTCDVHLQEGDEVFGRLVIAYAGDRQWAITCRLDRADADAATGCQDVIDRLAFR